MPKWCKYKFIGVWLHTAQCLHAPCWLVMREEKKQVRNHTSLNENYVVPCICLRAICHTHDSCYSSVARHVQPCMCHIALRHTWNNVILVKRSMIQVFFPHSSFNVTWYNTDFQLSYREWHVTGWALLYCSKRVAGCALCYCFVTSHGAI